MKKPFILEGITGQAIARPCECTKRCAGGKRKKTCIRFLAQTQYIISNYCVSCENLTWHASGACLQCDYAKIKSAVVSSAAA